MDRGRRERSKRLSTGEVASALSVTPNTVLKWIKRGRLRAARTAGGHHRISREDVAQMLPDAEPGAAAPTEGRDMYCWQYQASIGNATERCRECLVYRSRAKRCFEMSGLPQAGFAGVYCQASCEECGYYTGSRSRSRRVLVVTDSVRLRQRLKNDSRGCGIEIAFAGCEYECARLVEQLRPECVVIDRALSDGVCDGLCSRLAEDSRMQDVRILVATPDGNAPTESARIAAGLLPRPFSIDELAAFLPGGAGA